MSFISFQQLQRLAGAGAPGAGAELSRRLGAFTQRAQVRQPSSTSGQRAPEPRHLTDDQVRERMGWTAEQLELARNVFNFPQPDMTRVSAYETGTPKPNARPVQTTFEQRIITWEGHARQVFGELRPSAPTPTRSRGGKLVETR